MTTRPQHPSRSILLDALGRFSRSVLLRQRGRPPDGPRPFVSPPGAASEGLPRFWAAQAGPAGTDHAPFPLVMAPLAVDPDGSVRLSLPVTRHPDVVLRGHGVVPGDPYVRSGGR